MKKKVFSVILYTILLAAGFVNAQNLLPYDMVTNVRFSERYDGSYKVDIYYNLRNDIGPNMYVSMQASIDTGATWNFSCNQVSGDIGSGISAGIDKHIVWNFGSEHPNYYTNQARIKILATDSLQPCPGTPYITYAGQLYHTILIGSQCWMRENLNIGKYITSQTNSTNNGIIEKYCYNNDSNYCSHSGGLYKWDEAMQYSNVGGAQGICPLGWHIPTQSETIVLYNKLGGSTNEYLIVAHGGNNAYGFSAYIDSYCLGGNGTFREIDFNYWTSTFPISLSGDGWYAGVGSTDNIANSVRCVKD